jgi:disulfide bond formation protein DsbB
LFSLQQPGKSALALGLAASAVLAGAWAYQWVGYLPCELCLAQRLAYYIGIPLAFATAAAASAKAPRSLIVGGLALFALVFLYNTGLAIYHSGVEAKIFAGPTACTGGAAGPTSADDLLKQLETVKVVRCDAVSLRIFGLSMANWNVFISAGLAALAAATVLRRGPRAL